jgi:hypothetical protein
MDYSFNYAKVSMNVLDDILKKLNCSQNDEIKEYYKNIPTEVLNQFRNFIDNNEFYKDYQIIFGADTWKFFSFLTQKSFYGEKGVAISKINKNVRTTLYLYNNYLDLGEHIAELSTNANDQVKILGYTIHKTNNDMILSKQVESYKYGQLVGQKILESKKLARNDFINIVNKYNPSYDDSKLVK